MLTYNLGFFFGPGLPLGLAIASDGIGVDRFTPFAEMSFFFVSLGVVTSCEGAGVENVSEFVSCDAAGCSLGISSNVGKGDEAIDGESAFGMNLFSVDDGTFNTTILLCFLDDFSVRPLAVGVEGIVMVSTAKCNIDCIGSGVLFEDRSITASSIRIQSVVIRNGVWWLNKR